MRASQGRVVESFEIQSLLRFRNTPTVAAIEKEYSPSLHASRADTWLTVYRAPQVGRIQGAISLARRLCERWAWSFRVSLRVLFCIFVLCDGLVGLPVRGRAFGTCGAR